MLLYSKVSLPLVKEFKTSFGTEKDRNAILFILNDGEIEAYGESVTEEDPLYGYEDNFTALYVIRKYLAEILNKTKDPQNFMEKAERIKGHLMAKAALEMLLWDYVSKKEGKPLHEFIGHSKGEVEVGISIGMSTIDDMVNTVKQAVEQGYKRIKVKIEKGYDIEIVSAIREKFPNINMSVDANQSYSRNDFKIMEKLDEVFIMKDGKIKPFQKAGIGVSLDYAFLKRMEVDGGKLID